MIELKLVALVGIILFAPHCHIPSHCGGIPRAKNAEHTKNVKTSIQLDESIPIPKY